MTNEKDKKILKELKEDIFVNNFNIYNIMGKYKFNYIS